MRCLDMANSAVDLGIDPVIKSPSQNTVQSLTKMNRIISKRRENMRMKRKRAEKRETCRFHKINQEEIEIYVKFYHITMKKRRKITIMVVTIFNLNKISNQHLLMGLIRQRT